MWLLWILAACGPRMRGVPPHPSYAADGVTVMLADEPLRFAVVGPVHTNRNGIVHDIDAADPHFVVLGGDQVRRSTRAEWLAHRTRWSELPKIGLAGAGERSGDPRLTAFRAAYPEVGVEGIGPFFHFDVVTGDRRWRLVFLDDDPDSATFAEQTFWLPKVLSGGFDHLVLVSANPLVTLRDGATPEPHAGMKSVLGLVRDHVDELDLMAVIAAGGTGTNELVLLSGQYGEAYVVAGLAEGEGSAVRKQGVADLADRIRVGMQPAFYTATAGVDAGEPDATAARPGWWLVEAQGRTLALTWRTYRTSWDTGLTLRYTPEGGWE